MKDPPSSATATPTAPEPSTSALEADIRATRARVAADVEALKDQLEPESLKDRALEVAERSLENVALGAGRRLAGVPRTLARAGREHPIAATALGVGLVLLLWRVGARRRARRPW